MHKDDYHYSSVLYILKIQKNMLLKIYTIRKLLVAMSEEQLVAIDFKGLVHQHARHWWMNLRKGRSWEPWLQNVSYYCCVFPCLSLQFFSCIWCSVIGYGEILIVFNVLWLSHRNILLHYAFLSVDYCEVDFLIICMVIWSNNVIQ